MAFDGYYKHENFMFSKTEIPFLIPSLPPWSPTSSLHLEPFFVLIVVQSSPWPLYPPSLITRNPGGSSVKNPSAKAGDTGSVPGLGRSPG